MKNKFTYFYTLSNCYKTDENKIRKSIKKKLNITDEDLTDFKNKIIINKKNLEKKNKNMEDLSYLTNEEKNYMKDEEYITMNCKIVKKKKMSKRGFLLIDKTLSEDVKIKGMSIFCEKKYIIYKAVLEEEGNKIKGTPKQYIRLYDMKNDDDLDSFVYDILEKDYNLSYEDRNIIKKKNNRK